MFFGEYEYKIDESGKVSIPPRFRTEFKDGIVLTQGLERCITVYTVTEWAKLAETLAAFPFTRSKSRKINRITFSTAFSLELDTLGRITLPLPLRKYADINHTVIIVGANKCLEFWSRKHWDLEKSLMTEQTLQIFESTELR